LKTSRRQFIVGTCAVVAASSVSDLPAEPETAVLALGDADLARISLEGVLLQRNAIRA